MNLLDFELDVFLSFFLLLQMTPEETDKFLQEMEKKFANRYTEKDSEYARVTKTLQQGSSQPPLIEHKPKNHGNYGNHRRDRY